MTLSLRAIGLLTILQPIINDHNLSLDKLSKYTSDKQFFVENALKELEEHGIIRRTKKDNGTINIEMVENSGVELSVDQTDLRVEALKQRAVRLFGKVADNKTYDVICWFLVRMESDNISDTAFSDAINEMKTTAYDVQFWDVKKIEKTFDDLKSNIDKTKITMKILLDHLKKLDAGE